MIHIRDMFLQRLRKKNNDELSGENSRKKEEEEEEKRNEVVRESCARGNWIRKLGSCSPANSQVPSTPVGLNGMRIVDGNANETSTVSRASGSPESTGIMPDLESIIRDFEQSFMSPTKLEIPPDEIKPKNFVRKIVAAFEVKCKQNNASKTTHERREEDSPRVEVPRRKTRLFTSPFRSSAEESGRANDSKESRGNEETNDKSEKSKKSPENVSRRSGVFGSPFESSSREIKLVGFAVTPENESKIGNGRSSSSTPFEGRIEGSKGRTKRGTLSSSSLGSSSESIIYATPVDADYPASASSSSDGSSYFKFDREKIRASNFLFAPLQKSSLDETKSMEEIDLDATLPVPEEIIQLDDNHLPKTSTMINDSPDIDDCWVRDISNVDKTPKVVGAYLKRPIEVEDTSIDWIPITGKKLPRKRSLKKLLRVLSGRRTLEKRRKMFSSERNLFEEPRELQDSGYDEKSCSSSSLTSLISITEILMQENNFFAPERRMPLNSFRPWRRGVPFREEDEDEAFYDSQQETSETNKKLVLFEVPREELNLDLGPSFPPPKFATVPVARKTVPNKLSPPSDPPPPPPTRSPSFSSFLPKLPKHPLLSKERKIPKHPFISITKMDEHRESQELLENEQEPTLMVKNDLYEVEFRKSCSDVSAASRTSSNSAESEYDVPRSLLSKSENELRFDSRGNRTETVYDLPKSSVSLRCNSRFCEHALLHKRKSILLGGSHPSSVYAIPRRLEVCCEHVDLRKSIRRSSSDLPRWFNDSTAAEKRISM